jgi:predicted TIM-barrel fold metal-dependent hydrolase
MNIIDGYTHFIPKTYIKKLESISTKISEQRSRKGLLRYLSTIKKRPHFFDISRRLADLDKYEIDYEVTAVDSLLDPNSIRPMGKENRLLLCKTLNNEISEAMKASKGRVYALGTVPLANIDYAEMAEEMRRAIRDLGLKGFLVISNIEGKPIDKFEIFWREAEKLRCAVYIHPCDPASNNCRDYENEFDLTHVFGWPFETTLILSRLIFSGVLKRHPELKILGHHLGGMIPFFAGRLNESYNMKNEPTREHQSIPYFGKGRVFDLFKSFYYDTAVGGNPAAVRCGLETLGVERLVFATDYPFGPELGRYRLATYPEKIRQLGLSLQDSEKIFNENASRLLGL